MDSMKFSSAEITAMTESADSVLAQQKCAAAFLSMAQNDLIAAQFVQHDGISVVIKLGLQSNDEKVLSQCAQCFATLRSEEHTSELQSLMRISYAVFCLK